MVESDDDSVSTSLSRTRGRRSRTDKSGRLDALEQLKNARAGGGKHKYEVKELQNVYDVVDEGTYSRKVTARQRDDWIVDDGAGEYVEDGREIFDDDLIDDDDSERNKPKNKKEKAAKKAEKETQRANFVNVRDMLSAMPAKRKRSEVASSVVDPPANELCGDEMVGDVIREMAEKRRNKKSRLQQQVEVNNQVDVGMETPPNKNGYHSLGRDSSRFTASSDAMNLEIETPSPVTRVRHTIRKKKFVPFGRTGTSPAVASSTYNNSFYDDDSLVHNGFYDVDRNDHDIKPVTSTPVSNGITNSDPPNSIRDKAPAKPVLVTGNCAQKDTPDGISLGTAQPFGSKPSIPPVGTRKPVRHFTTLEHFGCNGRILNGNAIQDTTGFDDLTNFFEEGDGTDSKIMNFFWLDMFEEPKNPGVLYLFGKVQKTPQNYVSACVMVKDLTRSIHLLIRETMKSSDEAVNGVDVYNEFDQVIAPRFKINEFKSRPVEKRYCFDIPDVPSMASYIEVRYSGTLPPLPADLEGETFSHVFGTGTPLMENFLLEKKLKGPSWLQIRNPREVDRSQQHSWCECEFSCSVGDVRLNEKSADMKIPPLVLASLNVMSTSDANSKKDTIVFIGVAIHKTFELQVPLKTGQYYHDNFCLLNKPPGEMWPLDVDEVFNDSSNINATKLDSERAMLGLLMAKLQQIDADIYLGHDLNFELLLLHLLNLKVSHWSKIGRLKRASAIGKNGKTLDYKSALAGRLYCDVKISAMELIRARSYDFPNLTSQVLGIQTEALTGPEIKEQFDSVKGLQFLKNWGLQHCLLNIRLVNELQVMPLALQITTIAGNTLFRTLLGGRSERNEYLLLHAFHSRGFIVPDKYRPFVKKELEGAEPKGEKKSSGPSYAGGMVLDPKKGFYDNFIVLMDFNSLYPSIIQEYNICFTTRHQPTPVEAAKEYDKGILPEEIRKLVESRRQVKALMKNSSLTPEQVRVYDIRQMALKLTANSMYGCLGFKNSRFYAKELAALITGHGRDILLKTKESVELMGFEVIYGDTDSLMINSNTTDMSKVYAIGTKIKTEVNKMYKLLELEIDGIFRFLLLLKKKKYAALVWNQKADGETSTSLELKGLDMVRRDWAPIASNTARLILDEIMSEQALDDKVFKICRILNEIAEKLKIGDIQLKDLLITKQLAKNPEDYKEAQGQYHVQVALRMNKSGTLAKKFRNGDTVPYLFCTDGLPHHLSELSSIVKAEDDEISEETKLTPDPKYYLAHQIHPVVSRICEPIEGLDAGRIAEELGMDASTFKRRRAQDDQDDKALGQETEAEKYIDCDKFKFHCPHAHCGKENRYESMFTGKDTHITFALLKCQECGGSMLHFADHLLNRLTMFIRKFVSKMYLGEYICEDPTCDNVDCGVPFSLVNGFPKCRRCHGLMCRDYNSSHLYKQLNYLYALFDMDKQLEKINDKEKGIIHAMKRDSEEIQQIVNTSETLKALVSERIQSSAYSEIKLGVLFQGLFPKALHSHSIHLNVNEDCV